MAADASEEGFFFFLICITHMVILQHLRYLCIILHKILIFSPSLAKMGGKKKSPLMFLVGRQAERVGMNFAEQIKLSKCK